jgi:LysM repeat protein
VNQETRAELLPAITDALDCPILPFVHPKEAVAPRPERDSASSPSGEREIEISFCLLNCAGEVPNVPFMKKISFLLAVALLAAPAVLHAQDAALEERLNKLSAEIQVLIEAKEAQNKRIDELAKAIDAVTQQQNKPNASYASQEDVKVLKEKLLEIDKKRESDNDKVMKALDKLGASLRPAPPVRPVTPTTSGTASNAAPANPGDGFYYEIKPDDTLSAIAKAYSDQGNKVTVKQILEKNPGLKAENLKVGTKIFIPKTKP